ncbi:MAG: radical SAM protein [Spirochaetia bacterium]|nr:radical SAM protein [Spirochaetia bacterium]
MNTYTHLYKKCRLCPRFCEVDRTAGERGYCGQSSDMRAAFAGIHRGEEPPVSMVAAPFTGSGTIFFTGCTLRCSYCQNRQISQKNIGEVISIHDFIEICFALEQKGAANINLVSGTQFIPSIREGIETARARGLTIPVVWNTSSFESGEGLQALLPVVDVFLADIKTLSSAHSREFCGSGSYPEESVKAVKIMVKEKRLKFGRSNSLVSGTIIRHLVIPGEMESTEKVLQWLGSGIFPLAGVLLSILVQFVGSDDAQRITESEYEEILSMLDKYGIEDGYIQELDDTDYTDWMPDFTHANPFPASFSDPVWHFKTGFISCN